MAGITEFLQKQAGKNVPKEKKVSSTKKKSRKQPQMDITAFLRKQAGKDPFEGMDARPKKKLRQDPRMDITAFLRKQAGKDPFEGRELPPPRRRRKLTDEERKLLKFSRIRKAIENMSLKVKSLNENWMVSVNIDLIASYYLDELQKALSNGEKLFSALENGETDEEKLCEFFSF